MRIVSACLCGVPCRYDGKDARDEEICRSVAMGEAIPVCPEVMGGLQTPRQPVELTGDGALVLDGAASAVTNGGEDVTAAFVSGAEKVLAIAKRYDTKCATLKKNSPSCGLGSIYDGSFSGKLIQGGGITARLLERNGIEVEVR